ncbi:helix-turn-helix transcriptional regulator [Paenibacillus sp. FSL R5-0636]|uniref:helix-turn-helix domain-containing protein n=1 Tax=Paenibacillus TaxID=44249 RepID=UPI00096F1F42|nr:helix-turn-helix transcriptional regulator [Paenibacillus odorifer]OMD05723.1 transcriptional regulator [Paenibacillus odorifer]OMD18226.1 transcriptional regulator [Paenibacillus odorifer]
MNSLIKKARKDAGLSIEKAAEEIGIPAGYLSQIENGHRHVDSERADKISLVYECERDQIFLAIRYAIRKVEGENSALKGVR